MALVLAAYVAFFSFFFSFALLLVSIPVAKFTAYLYDMRLEINNFIKVLFYTFLFNTVLFPVLYYNNFFYRNDPYPHNWPSINHILIIFTIEMIFFVFFFYTSYRSDYLDYNESNSLKDIKPNPYLQKSWTDTTEGFSKGSILAIVNEIQTINAAHVAFLVGVIDESKSTLKVYKDLTVIANFGNKPYKSITIKATDWYEIEFFIKLFLSKQFQELTNQMYKNMPNTN